MTFGRKEEPGVPEPTRGEHELGPRPPCCEPTALTAAPEPPNSNSGVHHLTWWATEDCNDQICVLKTQTFERKEEEPVLFCPLSSKGVTLDSNIIIFGAVFFSTQILCIFFDLLLTFLFLWCKLGHFYTEINIEQRSLGCSVEKTVGNIQN